MDLQETGTESGSVLRVGSTDVVSGDVTNQTQTTISVAQLEAAHTDPHPFETDYGFELILNLNESGGIGDLVSLDQLTLFFTDALGAVIPGVDSIVTLAGTPYLIPQFDGPGVGGAGWVFDVRFTPDQWMTFIASDTNRIGMSASLTGVSDGAETFFIRPAQVAAVPEPSGVFHLSLLAGAGVVSRVTRRRKRPLAA